MLKWVSDFVRVVVMKRSGRMSYLCFNFLIIEYGFLMLFFFYLYCVVVILWYSYELFVEYDLLVLLDREFFE